MPALRVLKPAPGGEKWVEDRMTFETDALSELPDRCYAFLGRQDYAPADGRRELILAHFGVPKFVASEVCFDSNGFFGRRTTYGEVDGKRRLTGCTTWLRYMLKMVKKEEEPHEKGSEYANTKDKDYQWYETSIFSRWEYPARCQILCVDTPFDLPNLLLSALADRESPPDPRDPFAMHADLWDRMIVYSDISVWRVRDPVRRLEQLRQNPGEMFVPANELSRHAIHVAEVLETAVETVTAMEECRAELHEHVPELDASYKSRAGEYARFQISLLRGLKLRSQSNRERLATEITFAFNSLSRQDNHLIKTISLLTMIFLPAMFVSAIFSTSFFDLGDKGWQASGKIWILWVTMVPATIIVIFIWQVWLVKDKKVLDFLGELGASVKGSVRGLGTKDEALEKPKIGEP